jgi:hypothetical protein
VAPLSKERCHDFQLVRREDSNQSSLVEQPHGNTLDTPVPPRHPLVHIRQHPGRFLSGPSRQVFPEAVKPELRVRKGDEEIHQPVGIALGSESPTRRQVIPEDPFEPRPDGSIHGR